MQWIIIHNGAVLERGRSRSFRNSRQKKDWVKGAYAVGVSSQLILGTRNSYGRYQDAILLNSLRRQTESYASRNVEPLSKGLNANK